METIYSDLTQLGDQTELPATPEDAVLERVENPQADIVYCVRFTAPEFTSLCPMTGQPDFAHLVIDYVPGQSLVESKSLKLFLGAFRNHGAFTKTARSRLHDALLISLIHNGCGSEAIGTHAEVFPSMCSGRPVQRLKMSGYRIRVSPLIAEEGDVSAGVLGKSDEARRCQLPVSQTCLIPLSSEPLQGLLRAHSGSTMCHL